MKKRNVRIAQYAMFSKSLFNVDFLTSGIGPDILMNMLEKCVIFPKWEA